MPAASKSKLGAGFVEFSLTRRRPNVEASIEGRFVRAGTNGSRWQEQMRAAKNRGKRRSRAPCRAVHFSGKAGRQFGNGARFGDPDLYIAGTVSVPLFTGGRNSR